MATFQGALPSALAVLSGVFIIGVMTGLIPIGVIIRPLILFVIVYTVGLPMLHEFHRTHGNMAYFLLVCGLIIMGMALFPFTRRILQEWISRSIYDLVFTNFFRSSGMTVFFIGAMAALAVWIMK